MSQGARVYKPYVLLVTRVEGYGVQEQGMVFKSRGWYYVNLRKFQGVAVSHGASVYKPYVLRVTRFEGDGVQEQGMVFKSRGMVFKSRGW